MKPVGTAAHAWRGGVRLASAGGAGLVVMLADTDAGNVVAAAQSGAEWGYRLLPLLFLLIPLLYTVQAHAMRLGAATGRGHGELVREQLGDGWRRVSLACLAVACASTFVTEFTGIAGVAQLCGVPRAAALLAGGGAVLAVVATGSWRRIESAALAIGLAEAAFLVMAWNAHPDPAALAAQFADLPLGNLRFAWLAAALVGAAFNPWMIYYQQAAAARQPDDADRAARGWTLAGAALTQLLSAAVLVVAATVARGGAPAWRGIDEIALAFTHAFGAWARVAFGLGVLSASLVAAIVCLQASLIGMHELRARHPAARGGAASIVLVAAAAAAVEVVPDLVRLNLVAQVVNALVLPGAFATLSLLAGKLLPAQPGRIAGALRWLWFGLLLGTCACGLVGTLSVLLD